MTTQLPRGVTGALYYAKLFMQEKFGKRSATTNGKATQFKLDKGTQMVQREVQLGGNLMTAFYTPQELAERWKVSARTVVRMTEAGDLPYQSG